jgi:hypothetical protein
MSILRNRGRGGVDELSGERGILGLSILLWWRSIDALDTRRDGPQTHVPGLSSLYAGRFVVPVLEILLHCSLLACSVLLQHGHEACSLVEGLAMHRLVESCIACMVFLLQARGRHDAISGTMGDSAIGRENSEEVEWR